MYKYVLRFLNKMSQEFLQDFVGTILGQLAIQFLWAFVSPKSFQMLMGCFDLGIGGDAVFAISSVMRAGLYVHLLFGGALKPLG